MSRKFEAVSDKKQPLPEGIKKITVEWPDLITGQHWVDWWDRYYETLGDFETNRKSPGAQLKAKYMATVPLLEKATYLDSADQIHDIKQEGLSAPLAVCQYVAQVSDTELYKDLQVPKP